MGVPDERWGEVGHLAVVFAEADAPGESALVAFLEARLARYKLPRKVVALEGLPRTATGKIQKSELRALLMARTGQQNP